MLCETKSGDESLCRPNLLSLAKIHIIARKASLSALFFRIYVEKCSFLYAYLYFMLFLGHSLARERNFYAAPQIRATPAARNATQCRRTRRLPRKKRRGLFQNRDRLFRYFHQRKIPSIGESAFLSPRFFILPPRLFSFSPIFSEPDGREITMDGQAPRERTVRLQKEESGTPASPHECRQLRRDMLAQRRNIM